MKCDLFDEIKEINKRLGTLENIVKNMRTCPECGKLFVAKRSDQICCSRPCTTRRNNRKADGRLNKNGQMDSNVTLSTIYLRDKGVCQACGRLCSIDTSAYDDAKATIDHKTPIKMGGKHTLDNVQLLCRHCNLDKGATDWKEYKKKIKKKIK